MPGASCPSAHSGAVWGSSQPLGRRPRSGVRGRFKASAGRGRRRRPGWLARSRKSAARGPAGAALPPPGASEEAAAEGGSPVPAGARGEPPGSPAGRRRPGALFRSGAGGVAGGVARSALAGLRCAAPGCTRAAGSGCAWPLSPTTGSGVTVCSGEVARHSNPSGEGLAAAQADSFDCSHPGVPRLPG